MNNKDIIYKNLKLKGISDSAICGIMANMYYESGYNPNVFGDGGTSYGLCQWHLGRKANLQKLNNYGKIEVQIDYLFSELRTSYKRVLDVINTASNDENGAYNVGYNFCKYFEIPADTENQAKKRGNYAKELFRSLNITTNSVDIDKLANDVIKGIYGNGEERKKKLGSLYNQVQARVNEILNKNKVYYTIKRGDTLSSIAKKYKVTIKSLVELNNIKNKNLIYAGDTIRIK